MTTPIPPPAPAIIAPIFETGTGKARSARSPLIMPLFLNALAQVESGNNPKAIGKRGELGLYQFREITWHMHTAAPFAQAKDPQVAGQVADEHVRMIERALQSVGIEANARNVALCWNAGIRAVMLQTFTATSAKYAERVADLYGAILGRHAGPIMIKIRRANAAAK